MRNSKTRQYEIQKACYVNPLCVFTSILSLFRCLTSPFWKFKINMSTDDFELIDVDVEKFDRGLSKPFEMDLRFLLLKLCLRQMERI